MAVKNRDGSATILMLIRKLCKYWRRYGSNGIITRMDNPDIATILGALSAACMAWEALDNHPGEREDTGGDGPEDLGDGGGSTGEW
jgi:hypothetical protein